MGFEYWHSTVDSSYDGYESVFYKIKEIVYLEKKSQKLLRKLFYPADPKVLLLQNRTNFLKGFELDILPLAHSTRRFQYDKWPEIQVDKGQSTLNPLREKLKVNNNNKKLFIWLTGLSGLQIPHRLIARYTNELKLIKKFRLDYKFLTSGNNGSSEVKYRPMPSLLRIGFQEAPEENIPQVASPNFNEKFTMERNFHKRQNYTFEIGQEPVTPKESPKFEKWQQPSIAHRNEIIFKILTSQLFKVESNGLESFKIKENCPYYNREPKRKLPNNCKISRLESKQLECNSFEQMEEIITTNGDLPEEAQTLFMPNFQLKFHLFPYSSLDFIGMEENTFESLQCISPSRLSQRPIEEPLAANKQQKRMEKIITSQIDSVSMIVRKRSSINGDIQLRKRNRKSDDCINMKVANATMFHTLHQNMNRSPIVGTNTVPSILEQPEGLRILLTRTTEKPRRVLVNARKVRKNHKITQYLVNATKLQLVEQELTSQCDFVVSATSCIFIARFDLFFRLQPNNTMFYENTFKELLNEFKTVIVLMKYPEIIDRADKDSFWKLRLFLQPPTFHLFLVRDLPQEIGQWIDIISNRPQNGQLLDFHPLHLLHFNKFLVQDLLSRYTYEQILIIANANHTKELSRLLTNAQLKRIQKLMAFAW